MDILRISSKLCLRDVQLPKKLSGLHALPPAEGYWQHRLRVPKTLRETIIHPATSPNFRVVSETCLFLNSCSEIGFIKIHLERSHWNDSSEDQIHPNTGSTARFHETNKNKMFETLSHKFNILLVTIYFMRNSVSVTHHLETTM